MKHHRVDSQDEIEFAVFTLPDMVAFEGQHHLLHIFEKRYRAMIKRCVAENIPLGLALPDVNSEQNIRLMGREGSTLEPESIVGAGPVNIVKALDDGRMLVAINIEYRIQIQKQVQSVPYVVAKGVEVPSRIENKTLADFTFSRLRRLSKEILGDKFFHFEKRVADTIWENHSLNQLMVRIMEWFRLDSKELQRLLDEPVLENRASRFADVMEFYLRELKADHDKAESWQESSTSTAEPATNKDSNDQDDNNVISVDFSR